MKKLILVLLLCCCLEDIEIIPFEAEEYLEDEVSCSFTKDSTCGLQTEAITPEQK